jgi:methylmalonyl-CoA/ethylmalonyl-CoA epimerase
MPDARVEFRRFHHLVIGVSDLEAAVADWTNQLAWPVAVKSTERATFPLDDSYIELVPADEGGLGVRSVSVVVDEVGAAVDRLGAVGVSVTMAPDGHALLDPASVNGVPMELRTEDADAGDGDPVSGGPGGPYRRLNHIVVAVSDDESAKASWAGMFGDWTEQAGGALEVVHHVPVGIAWFGLTGSGTDASALARFLERRGEGVYALALVVDDHPATIASLEQRDVQIMRQESSGQTFVHPKSSHGILMELVPERHPSRLG